MNAAAASLTTRWRHLLQQLTARRERRGSREVQAICPVDSWPFRPSYTDGRCPLCGWEPPGAIVQLPLSRRLDSFAWMLLTLLAVSVLMTVIVLVLYARA
jgi:hypothetical protein